MDEEEKKRQAASAAFAQAAETRNPYAFNGITGGDVEVDHGAQELARIREADMKRWLSALQSDEFDRNVNALYDYPGIPEEVRDSIIRSTLPSQTEGQDAIKGIQANPNRPLIGGTFDGTRYPFVDRETGRTIPAGPDAVPGASEAFAQLDQAQPFNPTQFDAASVAGLEPAQQQMVRENFDANLEAVTRAVEEYAQGDDAFSRQAQRLVERAERARERRVEVAVMPVAQKVQSPVPTPAKPEFTPLVTPSDWQTSANMKLTEQYGEDPFAF